MLLSFSTLLTAVQSPPRCRLLAGCLCSLLFRTFLTGCSLRTADLPPPLAEAAGPGGPRCLPVWDYLQTLVTADLGDGEVARQNLNVVALEVGDGRDVVTDVVERDQDDRVVVADDDVLDLGLDEADVVVVGHVRDRHRDWDVNGVVPGADEVDVHRSHDCDLNAAGVGVGGRHAAGESGNRESCRHARTNHEPRELTRHFRVSY